MTLKPCQLDKYQADYTLAQRVSYQALTNSATPEYGMEGSIQQFYCWIKLRMGQDIRRQRIIARPDLDGWRRSQSVNGAVIWVNGVTLEEMEQYAFMADFNQDYNRILDSFNLRLNHRYLVASRSIVNQPVDSPCGCGTTYQGLLYLERIPIRLSEINGIPFPDLLHVYNQAFHGFGELVQFVGYFAVEEDMICVNQQDTVKVWLHGDLSKIFPSSVRLNSEAEMIATIIDTIDRNTRQAGLPVNLPQFFRERNVQTFDQAVLAVHECATLYNSIVPAKMNCVTQLRLGRQYAEGSSINRPIASSMIVSARTPAFSRSDHLLGSPKPMASSVKNIVSASIVQPSRVGHSFAVSRIPQYSQVSTSRPKIKPAAGNLISKQSCVQFRSVPPVKRSRVSASTIKPQLKMSNAKVLSQSPVVHPLTTQTQTIARTPLNFQRNVESRRRNIQEGRSSDKIWDVIRRSRQQQSTPQNIIQHEVRRQVPPASPSVSYPIEPLRLSEYLGESPQLRSPTPTIEQTIITKEEISISQIQSQPKQSDLMSNVTRDLYAVTERQVQSNTQKFGDLTTEYRFSEVQSQKRTQLDEQAPSRQNLFTQGTNRIVLEQRTYQSRTFESPNNVTQTVQIQRKTNTAGYGSAATTSFQFYGFVGVGNSGVRKPEELTTNEVIGLRSQTQVRTEVHHRQAQLEEYLNRDAYQIESRIQAPSTQSIEFQVREEIREQTGGQTKEQIKQSTTYQQSSRPYETTYQTYQQKYTYTSQIPLYPSYSATSYEFKDYTSGFDYNYAPITAGNYTFDYKKYGLEDYSSANNQRDIYNLSSSYNNYGLTSDYTNYNVSSSYADYVPISHDYNLDYNLYGTTNTQPSAYDTNYTSSFTNNYNYNYGLDSYKNYDYDLLKYSNLNTYIEPAPYQSHSYDTYSFGNQSVPDIKGANVDLKDGNFNLQETHATLATYNPNASNAYSSDNYNYQINYQRTQRVEKEHITTQNTIQRECISTQNYTTQQYKNTTRVISSESHTAQYIASIYIPIQGYRVTLDNQLISDLQKLRARGLMQEAVEKERSREKSPGLVRL